MRLTRQEIDVLRDVIERLSPAEAEQPATWQQIKPPYERCLSGRDLTAAEDKLIWPAILRLKHVDANSWLDKYKLARKEVARRRSPVSRHRRYASDAPQETLPRSVLLQRLDDMPQLQAQQTDHDPPSKDPFRKAKSNRILTYGEADTSGLSLERQRLLVARFKLHDKRQRTRLQHRCIRTWHNKARRQQDAREELRYVLPLTVEKTNALVKGLKLFRRRQDARDRELVVDLWRTQAARLGSRRDVLWKAAKTKDHALLLTQALQIWRGQCATQQAWNTYQELRAGLLTMRPVLHVWYRHLCRRRLRRDLQAQEKSRQNLCEGLIHRKGRRTMQNCLRAWKASLDRVVQEAQRADTFAELHLVTLTLHRWRLTMYSARITRKQNHDIALEALSRWRQNDFRAQSLSKTAAETRLIFLLSGAMRALMKSLEQHRVRGNALSDGWSISRLELCFQKWRRALSLRFVAADFVSKRDLRLIERVSGRLLERVVTSERRHEQASLFTKAKVLEQWRKTSSLKCGERTLDLRLLRPFWGTMRRRAKSRLLRSVFDDALLTDAFACWQQAFSAQHDSIMQAETRVSLLVQRNLLSSSLSHWRARFDWWENAYQRAAAHDAGGLTRVFFTKACHGLDRSATGIDRADRWRRHQLQSRLLTTLRASLRNRQAAQRESICAELLSRGDVRIAQTALQTWQNRLRDQKTYEVRADRLAAERDHAFAKYCLDAWRSLHAKSQGTLTLADQWSFVNTTKPLLRRWRMRLEGEEQRWHSARQYWVELSSKTARGSFRAWSRCYRRIAARQEDARLLYASRKKRRDVLYLRFALRHWKSKLHSRHLSVDFDSGMSIYRSLDELNESDSFGHLAEATLTAWRR
ncbi:hypothetical protein PYCC9005_003992 [Savitreella phatthalungensis]